MISAAAVALAVVAADPRVPLVQLQLAGRPEEALAYAEAETARDPRRARELGFDYLRGHLFDRLGRGAEAVDAFAAAMGNTPRIEPFSRYRLALQYEEMDHPEVAAGLVASVVGSPAPRSLLGRAVELLQRTVAAGGDCRLLNSLDPARLPRREGRSLRLALGQCADRRGDIGRAAEIFAGLLAEEAHDEAEWEAARALAALRDRREAEPADPAAPQREVPALLGLAFHQHRDFERSTVYLGRVVAVFGDSLEERHFEIGYANVRGIFWQGKFDQAAQGFGWLAQRSPAGEQRAQAFYQQGRSFELAGRRRQALESFRAAYRADEDGRWADAAIFAMLRLKWFAGSDEEAQKLYSLLAAQRSWRGMAGRAALFLASSDLVRGRSDRAGPWLDQAARVRLFQREAEYWRGRLAELEDDPRAAVESYLAVLRREVFHPLAEAAGRRLALPHLAPVARERGIAAARQGRSQDLYDAWLLLGADDPAGREALDRLRRRLASDRLAAPFVGLERVPEEDWPLWQAPLRQPEEMLLALGVVEDGAPVVSTHFPLADPGLGFTGGEILAAAGQTRRSIRVAEILRKRVPSRVPEPLLPEAFRRLLHPFAHRDEITAAAGRHGSDALLLAAIIREESRFDAGALSNASARGLTQFVQPTARRLASSIGLGEISPRDVYRPPVAIALGAAYLAELSQGFDGRPEVVVAAYNAGEAQAELWREYCASAEPEEYFTKVSFRQTREYLAKVLGSWARYRDLYGSEEEGDSTRSTTGGSSSG